MLISHSTSRRRFIKIIGSTALAYPLFGQQIIGANSRLRFALIGCGNRGKELVRHFLQITDLELAAVCDADLVRMDETLAMIDKHLTDGGSWAATVDPRKVDKIQDYRKLYERTDIDIVVIATPNYWHALQAAEAMAADMHVYVEKPVNFTLWEGLQLEAAEKRYGKVIAAGYQNRSDKGPQAGIQFVQEGNLGKIRKVRSLCYRNRASIGKIAQPLRPPATIDYNLWLGPAQDKPIYRPKFHYDWHWDFNTGNGDVGNQGVHEIDMVCWLLGEPQLPSKVQSIGNRFAWDDAGNTPNLQTVWYQQGDVEVILETNDITLAPDRNVSPHRIGTRVGIIAECEKGILKGGRGGMVAVEHDGRTPIQKFPGDGGGTHQQNFIDAVRTNDASILTSRIATAHRSASLAHLGNISYRCGSEVSIPELKNRIGENTDVHQIIANQKEQLAAWGITNPKYRWGKTIEINPASEIVTTDGVGTEMTGPYYRKNFEWPKMT